MTGLTVEKLWTQEGRSAFGSIAVLRNRSGNVSEKLTIIVDSVFFVLSATVFERPEKATPKAAARSMISTAPMTPVANGMRQPKSVRIAAMPRMIPAWAAIRRPSARSLPARTLLRRIGATKNLSMNPDSRSDHPEARLRRALDGSHDRDPRQKHGDVVVGERRCCWTTGEASAGGRREDRAEGLAEHDEPDQRHEEAEEQQDRSPRELHQAPPRDEAHLGEDPAARFLISCPNDDPR